MKKAAFGNRIFSFAGSKKDTYFLAGIPEILLEDEVVAALSSLINESDHVLDIGANIGVTTCVLASLANKGRVYSFEPSPEIFRHLQQNIKNNNFNNVKATQVALGDKEQKLNFYFPEEFGAGSFIASDDSIAAKHHKSDKIEVECIKLDQFVEREKIEKIDLIKMDVEGHELAVLKGAEAVLSRHKPKVILEFNSYAFVTHSAVLPTAAIERISEIFPYVYLIRSGGALQAIVSNDDRHAFVHKSFTEGGGVHNLLCCFEPAQQHPLVAELRTRILELESKVSYPRFKRVAARIKRAFASGRVRSFLRRLFD